MTLLPLLVEDPDATFKPIWPAAPVEENVTGMADGKPADGAAFAEAVNRSVEKLVRVSGEDTLKFMSVPGAGREEPEPEEDAAEPDEPGKPVGVS